MQKSYGGKVVIDHENGERHSRYILRIISNCLDCEIGRISFRRIDEHYVIYDSDSGVLGIEHQREVAEKRAYGHAYTLASKIVEDKNEGLSLDDEPRYILEDRTRMRELLL